MNPRQGNVFIEDREQNESYEDPNERVRRVADQNENNSDDHNINDEEIDQLLDDDNQSKEELVLRFKVNELQKICNSLTNTNRKLIEKVTQLEEERDRSREFSREMERERERDRERDKDKQGEIFVDQYSELNGEITEVESLIHEYKESLDNFQNSVLVDMRAKEEKITKLKGEVKDIGERYNRLEIEKEDIEKLNKQLETRNEGLILEIENLEKERQVLQQRLANSTKPTPPPTPLYQGYSSRYDSHHNEYELPSQIQNQYEILIQKLVKQLEYEKNIKKKMNEEIKRMSHELMESQREIMSKNKKLYEIEMKLLRSSKTTADSSLNFNKSRAEDVRVPRHSNNGHGKEKEKEKSDQKVNLKSFMLLELINGELEEELSPAQRKIVGLKLVDLYERKMQRQDFASIMPQNLLVCNFSPRKPQLLSIRKTGSAPSDQSQKSQQSLAWNLAFILDNLFGQAEATGEFEELLELTGQVLQKKIGPGTSRECVQCMRELLNV